MQPVRVFVVDDSSVCRKLLTEALACNPQVAIAGTASTGLTALAKLPIIAPDVVTLDVEMPGMNGIETLKEIRRLHPQLPIIMLSALTETGATVTLEALSLGASDYVTKPSNTHSLSEAMEKLKHDLIPKIITLAEKAKRQPTSSPAPSLKAAIPRAPGNQRMDILAIGTSTGGPNALAKVLSGLPRDFPVPIVIVQHMPPLFTRMLAERLNSQSEITIREGEAGSVLVPGTAWIAPGDYHMKVERNGASVFINLDHAPPENSCRPAVDPLFRSVAQTYGQNSLAVVMTGMGSDGMRGALEIREKGGEVFAQDEASSVVWGMPGRVVGAGAADRIFSLSEKSSRYATPERRQDNRVPCPCTAYRSVGAEPWRQVVDSTAAKMAMDAAIDVNDPTYLKIRDLIYKISGIYQSEDKMYLLAGRCARRMAALKSRTPADYLQQLTLRADRDAEIRLLLNEITIGETYMFRSAPQLDALRNVILPQIMQAKNALGFRRLRLWSAGCSTGEEPYTLAMFLLEQREKILAGASFEILATDLNDKSLDIAKEGIYGEYALKNVSELFRRKYFKPHDAKHLQVSDELKKVIRFDRVNLNDDSKMAFLKGMDLIFCCNVLIYFDLSSKRKVMQHFYANLLPGGYLFLGHAESLYQVDERFHLVHFPGTIGYWRPPVGYVAGGKQ